MPDRVQGSLTTDADGNEVPIWVGYPWPPYGSATVTVEFSESAPTEATDDTWTWKVRFDTRAVGETPDLEVTVDSATLDPDDDTKVNLSLTLTASETADLHPSRNLVQILHEDSGGNAHAWGPVMKAEVRQVVGQAD